MLAQRKQETPARPAPAWCPTFADHEFGAARVVAAGRHPVRGHYHRTVRQCSRCPKQLTETVWTETHGVRWD